MLARSSLLQRYAHSATIAKLKTEDHLRVERLVAKMERSVRLAFLNFVQNVQSAESMREVAELLGRNDVEGAMRIVDRYILRLAPVISNVFVQSAAAETAALADQISRILPSAGISFDPTYRRAAELMRDAQLRFLQQLTVSQRDAVRQALTQALIEGEGPIAAAKAFRSAIGLNTLQVSAIQNYRRLLLEGSKEALSRDLRDRRYDSTVRRAATEGDPLTAKQIDTMVERYRQRSMIARAEMIARTETGSVVSAARQEAFDQVVEETGITDDMVERTWRSTGDKRTRDSHRSMNGQKVEGRTTPFISGAGVALMRPHDPDAPASETIQCRCVQTLRIKKRGETG